MSNSPTASHIYELSDNPTCYAAVESTYVNPVEGKGEKDAVSIYMGHEDVNAIDALISVSTMDARSFAQAIIAVCDEIEKGE
ncbi:hypothetical protein [Cytobacillus oceanisediminis]|uniref:Uncharacterized protein n=1 Tax=Cytobacillus oceanisediminis 2691 TaxID=1196031 RepID=A0A169FLL8_9BACI|nr:hypothetical protein [Cytobacillus oceanisediminis]AND39525.1 hypothetical protein A361_10400 [Cytobacillus oceanisediminis 2691]